MPSWKDELDQLLRQLGVRQEHTEAEDVADFVLLHASARHPGINYRLELVGATPHLYVFIPADEGLCRLHIYHVLLADDAFLAHLFALYMAHQGGSPAFQEVEGACTYQLFLALAEIMKALFWKGDLAEVRFPTEIEVKRLL